MAKLFIFINVAAQLSFLRKQETTRYVLGTRPRLPISGGCDELLGNGLVSKKLSGYEKTGLG
jgi:hypothetical protein